MALIWTAEAAWWMREVHEYMIRESPRAAERILRGIRDRARRLTVSPEAGRPYHPERHPSVRVVEYAHYRIFYERVENGDVHVLGVFSGRRTRLVKMNVAP